MKKQLKFHVHHCLFMVDLLPLVSQEQVVESSTTSVVEKEELPLEGCQNQCSTCCGRLGSGLRGNHAVLCRSF